MEIQDNYVRHVRQIVDIHDGDTLTALIDVGYDIYTEVKYRLKGINTAELKSTTDERKQLALKAKQYVVDHLSNTQVRVLCEKFEDGGFGRYLATVYYLDNGDWIDLNQKLLDEHLAQKYYRGASKDNGDWHD